MAAVTLAVHLSRVVFTGGVPSSVFQLSVLVCTDTCVVWVLDCGREHVVVRLRVVVFVEGLCDKPSAY